MIYNPLNYFIPLVILTFVEGKIYQFRHIAKRTCYESIIF